MLHIKECIIKFRILFINLKNFISRVYHDEYSIQNAAKDLVSILTILVILVILIQVIRGINHDYIVIDQFEVPEQLIKNGYTSKTIINKLEYEIKNIANNQIIKNNSLIINTSTVAVPDIVIPGATNTLRSLILYIKETFFQPPYIVTGNIVNENSHLKLMLEFSGKRKLKLINASEIITNKEDNIDNMIKYAAERLYIQVDPLVMAGYYYSKNNHSSVITICKVMARKPEHAGITYTLWARSLLNTRQYDEALSKCQLADCSIASINTKNLLYKIWGDTLRKACKFDDALNKYRLAVDTNPNDSYPYYMIGDILILQSKYNESIEYLNKAIELDKNVSGLEHSIMVIANIINSIKRLDKDALDPIKDHFNELIITNRSNY